MMIKDDALSQRLNAVKKGGEIPIPPPEDIYFTKSIIDPSIKAAKIEESLISKVKPGIVFAANVYNMITVLGMSLLFGIGIKAIFSTSWGFLGILGVGLIVDRIFNIISRLKLFK